MTCKNDELDTTFVFGVHKIQPMLSNAKNWRFQSRPFFPLKMWQIWGDFFPDKSFAEVTGPLYFILFYFNLIFDHQLAKFCQKKKRKEKKRKLAKTRPKKKRALLTNTCSYSHGIIQGSFSLLLEKQKKNKKNYPGGYNQNSYEYLFIDIFELSRVQHEIINLN